MADRHSIKTCMPPPLTGNDGGHGRPYRAPLFAIMLSALALACVRLAATPPIEHWTAESGARVYFVPAHGLPMLDFMVDFPAGSVRDPASLAGLAAMTRDLLATGAGELSEQDLAERIADLGAEFSGGADHDRAGLTVRTLSSSAERDAAATLAATILAQPTFPEAIVTREKDRRIAALRDALTRPNTLAARAFTQAIYGEHPYGLLPDPESLARIGRDDLADFHRRHYLATNAVVTIVGDITRPEAAQLALLLTKDLPDGAPPPALPPPRQPQATVVRIPHHSAQAHMLIGMPGMARQDSDYYPLLVGNHVLGGGGFVSRLSREVRQQRGFAYSIYSFFLPRETAGPFQIGLQTRGAQADEAWRVIRETLAAFIAAGPTPDELKAAQDNIINGFGLRLDSNRKLLEHVAMIGFYRLPDDWLDTYTQHVAQVTAADIKDAFARRVRPEHLVAVIAGGDGDREEK